MDSFGAIEIRANRSVHLKRRINTPTVEVNTVQHLLSVFREHGGWIAVELEWKPGVVLSSDRQPNSGMNLVAKTAAHRIALVLRIREVPGELRFGSGRVTAEKK